MLLGVTGPGRAVERPKYQDVGAMLEPSAVVHPCSASGGTRMGDTDVICALYLKTRFLGKLRIHPDFKQRLFLHPREGGRLWQIGDKYMTQGSQGKHRQTATLEEQGLGWMEPAFLKASQSRDALSQLCGQETLPAPRCSAELRVGAGSPQGPQALGAMGKGQRVPGGIPDKTPEQQLLPWEMQCLETQPVKHSAAA